MGNCVTALYDCRSKQEYIYRTTRIREITGGSNLLRDVYDSFIKTVESHGICIKNDWKINNDFSKAEFESSSFDGEVIYNGGGNLCIIYKSKDTYIKANKIFTRMLLEKTYTISIIAACVETTDDFVADRRELYKQNAINKNTDVVSIPCNVLPFTQIDNYTYQPIVKKENYNNEFHSFSNESSLKTQMYVDPSKKQTKENEEIFLDEIITEKGQESLLAVIYVDGNAMGNKVKAITDESKSNSYDEIVPKLRDFSVTTDNSFVTKPVNAIQQKLLEMKNGKYRQVIAGGDEITIICNARSALEVVKTYFDNLTEDNYACAGIVIFHSHAPFAEAYKIAEQCCENGKKHSRKYKRDEKNISLANFVDFHYCHSGITNDMDTIRESQEAKYTCRPYLQRYDSSVNISDATEVTFDEFYDFGKKLSAIGRANIKELSQSIIKGDSYYKFEIERIKSRDAEYKALLNSNDEKQKKLIFDIAQVYDLWFAGNNDKETKGDNA